MMDTILEREGNPVIFLKIHVPTIPSYTPRVLASMVTLGEFFLEREVEYLSEGAFLSQGF